MMSGFGTTSMILTSCQTHSVHIISSVLQSQRCLEVTLGGGGVEAAHRTLFMRCIRTGEL